MPLYDISRHPEWSYTHDEHLQMEALDAATAHTRRYLENRCRAYGVEMFRWKQSDISDLQKGELEGLYAALSGLAHLAGETGWRFYAAARQRAGG